MTGRAWDRALVFDLDDTLYLEREFALSGFAYLEAWVEARWGVAGFGALCAETFEAGRRGDIFDAALARLGLQAGAEEVRALVEAYRGHPPRIALAEDADACLATVRDGAFLGVITDGPEGMQMSKASALGLPDRVGLIRATGAWPPGFGKPHPRSFEEMEAASGCAGTRLVYIADNPAKDFVTPKARGWLTVQIDRPGRIHPAEAPDAAHAAAARITTLATLEETLAGLGWG